MDEDYHQECMTCEQENIGSKKVNVPEYSEKVTGNPSHGGAFNDCQTKNQFKDCENNTEPKDSGEGYSLALKEAICVSSEPSSKSNESTTTGTETRETEPENVMTSLEENWDDTIHRQECGEELKELSSEEIVLEGDVSKRLENVHLQHNSPTSSGCGEDGSIVAEEKKASYLSIIFLIFMVTVYPGFIAIIYLYFVLYVKPRMVEVCGQSNICNSTVENFGLLHIRYDDNEIYHARYMVDEIWPACLEAIISEYKLAAKLFIGKKVSRALLEDSEDGDISNSTLNTSEDSDVLIIDDSTDLSRKKPMEKSVQIDDFNISDDHCHCQTYRSDLPVNDSGFINISSSVNEMPCNYEESELSDFSSKTECQCEIQLKVGYNILEENSATAKNCSKAPVECFGTSNHGCNESNMSLAIQSSSEKTDASTSSSNISVDNDGQFSYSHTSWTGEVAGKSHKENNEIQNGEDNKEDARLRDRINVSHLQDNCLPWVSFVDDAPLQEGNDENDESNYRPKKQGVGRKTPIVDDPKLGKVLTLTTDSIRCQDQNCSPLTDVSNVVYGDFKILADSVNPNTSNECSTELVGKCGNKSNNSTEVSDQLLQNESGSHQTLNNTCVPCCNLKMRKVYSEISHDNNISALTADCIVSSHQDCSSEIDKSDGNHFTSKGSSNILYKIGGKLRDPDSCLINVDLSNNYGDYDITHNRLERASNRCKKVEDTKFRQFNYDNVTSRSDISRDQRCILIITIDKFLDGLKWESEILNSICDKSKEVPNLPSFYLKRENERRERNTMEMQGRTKLGCIYTIVDGAKVHRKMLIYQRKVGLYPGLCDWKNYTNSKKRLPQILQYGSNLQIVVYLGYIRNINTLPVNNEADEESDHSVDDGRGEDSDDDQDGEDDHQNSGIVERDIFVPPVRQEELHDYDVSMEGGNQHQNVVGDNFQPVVVLHNQDDHQNDVVEVNVEGIYNVAYNQDSDIAENILVMGEVRNNMNAAEMPVWENENALMDENVSAILNGRFHPAADDIPEGDHQNTENLLAIHIDLHQFDVEEDFENNLIATENVEFHDINEV